MINTVTTDARRDMRITMHLCRGNFRSSFIATGGYEPVADVLFNQINVDGYFMEWDTDRAGGFEPLRLLPKGKMVVLGLVTSKTGTLESKEAVISRINEAARYADLDQLCLSPQCGFASTEEGNMLAENGERGQARELLKSHENCGAVSRVSLFLALLRLPVFKAHPYRLRSRHKQYMAAGGARHRFAFPRFRRFPQPAGCVLCTRLLSGLAHQRRPNSTSTRHDRVVETGERQRAQAGRL